MVKHKIIFLMIASFLLLFSVGCSKQPQENEGTEPVENLELTLEELAEYNGKDGNPAYIAVEGVIYDVTNSKKWEDGEHNGFTAGEDLTDKIKEVSPHGTSVLSKLPVVGEIVE
jgi:predicted heme/steroid binding protein